MNTESTMISPMRYYLTIALVATVSAIVLAPTPDFLTLIFLSLLTIPSGLLVGFVIQRYVRFFSTGPKLGVIFAAFIGAVGAILGFLAVNLIFRLF